MSLKNKLKYVLFINKNLNDYEKPSENGWTFGHITELGFYYYWRTINGR